MSKFKQLKEKVEKMEKTISELNACIKEMPINLRAREFLIRTDFFGNIQEETNKNKMIYSTYGKNELGLGFSFEDVKNEILNYEFRHIQEVLANIHLLESKEYSNDMSRYSANIKSTMQELATQSNIVQDDIDKADAKISGKTVINTNEIVKKKETRGGKKSAIDKYYYAHPTKYYIENLDKYYKRMYNLEEKYRIPKNRVVTLINAIVDNPTLEKLMKALNVSRSTIGNYLATLTSIGITKGSYIPKILLSDDVILKEYRG